MLTTNNEIRKVITEILHTKISKVYYRKAPLTTHYPYVTYFLSHKKIEYTYEYSLEVHVWTRDIKEAERIADDLEELDAILFNAKNITFDMNLENRKHLQDEDKELQHIVVLFSMSLMKV